MFTRESYQETRLYGCLTGSMFNHYLKLPTLLANLFPSYESQFLNPYRVRRDTRALISVNNIIRMR